MACNIKKVVSYVLGDKSTKDVPNNMTVIGGTVFLEKQSGEGEDAEPILLDFCDDEDNLQAGLLAVFDGLGGAGAAKVDGEEGVRTGAFYASRIARTVVEETFADAPFGKDKLSDRWHILKSNLESEVGRRAEELDAGSDNLTSSLISQLPTTVAGMYFEITSKRTSVDLHTFWAGDSRCYTLRPDKGLQQLTGDDLKQDGDAMESLRIDSPMSNYVAADKDFALNVHSSIEDLPVLLISATDGCFDYLPSPMHFEQLILNSLSKSGAISESTDMIRASLDDVAGDDASMTLLAIGWQDFDSLQSDSEKRLKKLESEYTSEIEIIDKKIDRSKSALERLREKKTEKLNEFWKSYKQNYEIEKNQKIRIK